MTEFLRYEIELRRYSIREDDLDSRYKVRRNGKVFFINVSPSKFADSPLMTEKWLSFIQLLKSGDEELGGIYEEDVDKWVLDPFEPFFAELAPDSQGDKDDIELSLKDYLFPEFFDFDLDVIDEERHPRRLFKDRAPDRPSWLRFEDDFVDDLETWTAFYDPSNVVLSYPAPVGALFKHPKKVLIDDCRTECSISLALLGSKQGGSWNPTNASTRPTCLPNIKSVVFKAS